MEEKIPASDIAEGKGLPPEEGDLEDEAAQLVREAREARGELMARKFAQLREMFFRGRIRHQTSTRVKPGRRHKGKKRTRREVAGRLPHVRQHLRPDRNMRGWKRPALCNQRQVPSERRRREQDAIDAAKLANTDNQAVVQQITRQLTEARKGEKGNF